MSPILNKRYEINYWDEEVNDGYKGVARCVCEQPDEYDRFMFDCEGIELGFVGEDIIREVREVEFV